jgi:hypothetical protein
MSVFNFPQFEDEYDGYKMRVLVDEVIRQFQAIQQEAPAAGGGGGGVSDHVLLTGRSNADQHPIAAITGLQAALNAKANQVDLAALTLVVNSNTNSIIALQIDLAAHLVDFLNPHDVTLQQTYDQVTTPPQININATPDPLTIDATVAGEIFAVRDVANVDVLSVATTGITFSDAYTFPTADGLDRQILVTDGAGVLTFEDQGTTAGLLSAEYRFSTTTAAADPGAGRFRFDTGAYSTVTEIFIDILTDNGADITNLLTQIAIGDRLYFQNRTDAAKFVAFDVIADAVDNTGWFTIGVNAIAEGTFLGNNDRCIFIWSIDGGSSPQRLEYEAMSTRSLVNSDFTIGSTIAEGVSAVAAGTGALVFSPTAIQDDHPGIWGLRTGTTAAGRVFIIGRVGSYNIGVGGITRVGTWVRAPATLSDAVEEYVLRSGFFSISLPNTIDFGVGFEYQFDQNGGRWQGITDATAESSLDTAITVVVDTWYFLELEINTDATSVEFFIDQASVGTLAVAANIPQGTGFNNFYNTHIMKLAGTTSRDFFVDAYYTYQELTR